MCTNILGNICSEKFPITFHELSSSSLIAFNIFFLYTCHEQASSSSSSSGECVKLLLSSRLMLLLLCEEMKKKKKKEKHLNEIQMN